MSAWQTTVSDWAAEEKKKLHPRIRRLIAMANFDLYYGPVQDGDDEDSEDGSSVKWPGFVKACDEIREALSVDDGPLRTLYVDNRFGENLYLTRAEAEEEEGENYSSVDSDYVLRCLVGGELKGYI